MQPRLSLLPLNLETGLKLREGDNTGFEPNSFFKTSSPRFDANNLFTSQNPRRDCLNKL